MTAPAGAATSSPPRRETLAPPDWTEFALCAQVDPEIFFPGKGGSLRQPKVICRACEVRAECLEYALERGERWGIYGGLSPQERRRLKRVREAAA